MKKKIAIVVAVLFVAMGIGIFATSVQIKDESIKLAIAMELEKITSRLYFWDLQKLRKVETLELRTVGDFSELKYFPNLKSLKVDQKYRFMENPDKEVVKNDQELWNLKNLEYLSLTEVEMKNDNITGVNELKKLKILELRAMKLPENFSLSNKKIENVTITYSNLKNFSFLKSCQQVNKVELTDNQINDISDIAELKNIEYLTLLGNEIVDISALDNLKNLKRLFVNSNKIVNISILKNLKKLEYLSIGNNPLESVSVLRELENISGLEMSELGTISNLVNDVGSCKNLTLLNLSGNEIVDIRELGDLVHLKELSLDDNEISDISPLANMAELDILSLENNQIENLSSLENLKNLTMLDLDYNMITDLEPLKGLVRLEVLEIEGNKINDYSVLQLLPELDERYKAPYVEQ